MYPVSNAYLIEILKNDRVTDIYGTITLTNGSVINLTKGDFAEAPVIDWQCSGTDNWTLGSVNQSQLKFSFYSNLDRYLIYDATVKLFFALWIPGDERWEEVPIGIYRVVECTLAGLNKLKVTLLDNMDLLDADYDGATVSGKPYDILNLISVKSGVPLGQTESQIATLPNGTVVFGLPATTSIQNYRDMLRDLSVCLTISADNRGNDTIADYKIAYSAVSCNKNGTVISVGTDDRQLLELEDNQFLQLGLDETVEDILDNILDAVSDFEFVPGSLSLLKSDPSFDPGDVVTATGYTSGTATLMPIHKMSWKWGGGQKIEAYGQDPRVGKTKSKSQKSLENKLDKIAALENDVLPMQNVSEVGFSASWAQLATGSVALADNKKILFHAAVRVTMDEPGSVRFKYQLNGVDEDFIHECQVPEGLHTITLFHYISGTSVQLNRFKVFVSSPDSSGVVERLGFNGVLTGPGMIEPGFDGNIELSDEIPPLIAGHRIVALADSVISIDRDLPYPNISLADSFSPLIAGHRIVALADSMSITREKEQFNLVTENGDRLATEDGDTFVT